MSQNGYEGAGDLGGENGLASVHIDRAFSLKREFLALATGQSGNIELERAWLGEAWETFTLFCSKQRDYGVGNIARIGEAGVLSRTIDKVERLENLGKSAMRSGPANESTLDSWRDIADYGIIGALCHLNLWPKKEAKDAS